MNTEQSSENILMYSTTWSPRVGLCGALLGGQQAPHILFLCVTLGRTVAFVFPLCAFCNEIGVETH